MRRSLLMKKTKFFMCASLVLAAACALTFAGCSKDPAPEPDTALRGPWTNNAGGALHAGLVKTFTIGNDFSFEASINPVFITEFNTKFAEAIQGGSNPEQAALAGNNAVIALATNGVTDDATRWTVTGKLTAEGDGIYIMSNLTETTNKPAAPDQPAGSAAGVLSGFGGAVKLTFTKNDKTAFKFESAQSGPTAVQVNAFFGGDYTRILN
jgi:hypothetical protein